MQDSRPSLSPERPLDDVLAAPLAAAGVGAWRLDLATMRSQATPVCKAIFGLPPDAGMSFEVAMAAIHPEDRPAARERVERSIATGAPYESDYRVVWPDGSVHWVRVKGGPEYVDGRPATLAGVCIEITDRKLADMELREMRERDAFRLALTDAIRPLTDPRAIKRAAAQLLGEHLRASRTLYSEILDGGTRSLVEDDHCRDGATSLAGDYVVGCYGHYTSDRCARGETVVVHAVAGHPDIAPAQQEASATLGIGAMIAVPLVKQGRWVACLTVHHATPRAWTPEEVALVEEVAVRTWSEVERARTEVLLRASEQRLQADLADAKVLQEVSATLIHEADDGALYQRLVEAATALMQSQFASMQRLVHTPEGEAELELLASAGFDEAATRTWRRVPCTADTTCGAAVAAGKRIVESDIEAPTVLAGTPHVGTYRRLGIRAMQSTPLRARDGRVVGVISTHWARPHVPPDRAIRLLDILAREAADLLEQRQVRESLREANQRKDEFLATLAHELRNPLAPLVNGLHLLRRIAEDRPDVLAQVEMMRRQAGHLGRLVDDLLEVSRISRGTIELRRTHVALADVVLAAVETSRPLVDRARHSLSIELPPQPLTVHADGFRIAQALSNLINNAAKYTPEGGRITVALAAEDGGARVSVRDNGIGMPQELRGRVFDMFTQGEHTRERQQGGLGIGLTLVRSLVELHGGAISAHSDGLGQGSEFVVRLPLAEAPGASLQPVEVQPPAPRRQRQSVLVVDDNRDAADSLAILLRLSEREVRVRYDAAASLEAVAAEVPDLVLLDLGLPEMDGFEVCRRIRALPGGADIAIVALSGWGREHDRQRSREAGFDLHLTKPVDPDFLLYELDRLTRTAPRPA